jgi:2,4-dienoyl-CoA reductase-like NADH-dependent reductase (Old Yellow Enzyme family)
MSTTMWKPVERIKHELLEPGWPSAGEAARARLFSPIKIGNLELRERTWVPAMVPWRATDEGFVTDEILGWYDRFARGEPGVIVVEATGIRDIPSGPLLRIGHDRFIPGLRRLVETVRQASSGRTRLLIQIIDFLTIRRRPDREKFLRRYLTITDQHRERVSRHDDEDLREHLISMSDEELDQVLEPRELEDLLYGYRERVTDLHLPHIRDLPRVLPDLFGAAATRARTAGFDGVEIHCAHAYTMASFLSALNSRDDGYGGSRANRARLPLEVYREVRDRVGDDYTIGCRYLTEECIDGGNTVEDSEYFGLEFAKAGMDFLSLSRGGKFEDAKQPSVGWAAYPYTGPSGYECMPTAISDEQGPFGRNVEATARIRAAIHAAGLSTPVVVAGGMSTFAQVESILQNNQADLIAAARQSLADPDWFLKMRLGRGSEIRRCIYTNYCEGLDQKHKQVTCQLWDREALDGPDVALSSDGKRRLTAPRWKT